MPWALRVSQTCSHPLFTCTPPAVPPAIPLSFFPFLSPSVRNDKNSLMCPLFSRELISPCTWSPARFQEKHNPRTCSCMYVSAPACKRYTVYFCVFLQAHQPVGTPTDVYNSTCTPASGDTCQAVCVNTTPESLGMGVCLHDA